MSNITSDNVEGKYRIVKLVWQSLKWFLSIPAVVEYGGSILGPAITFGVVAIFSDYETLLGQETKKILFEVQQVEDFKLGVIVTIPIFFLISWSLYRLLTIKKRRKKKAKVKMLEAEKATLDLKLGYMKNLKFIEKTIVDRFKKEYQSLGNQIVPILKEYLLTIPIRYDYLIATNKVSKYILCANTTIQILDDEGTASRVKRVNWIFPVGEEFNRVVFNYLFDKETSIEKVVVNGKSLTKLEISNREEILKNGMKNFLYNEVPDENHTLKKFQLTDPAQSIEFDLANCFTKTKESWIVSNDNSVILYDRVKIKLRSKPKKFACYRLDKNKKWKKVSDTGPHVYLLVNCKRTQGYYTIEYFINYQENFRNDFYKKFKIEWEL